MLSVVYIFRLCRLTEAFDPMTSGSRSSTAPLESSSPAELASQLSGAGISTALSPSLPEVYRSIPVAGGAPLWRKLLAFAGPGYLIAVGYMDPGNWATDLGGGSQFGYALLSVVVLSSLMAIFLQALSAKLGIASGRDLAQACRESYSRPVRIALWILCEIAIVACDL